MYFLIIIVFRGVSVQLKDGRDIRPDGSPHPGVLHRSAHSDGHKDSADVSGTFGLQ